jgi:hypothetical protein
MRSYAEVAASTPLPPPVKTASPGQSLHQQISAIASQLGSVVAQDVEMVPQTAAPLQQAPSQQDAETEKQAMVAKIKQLETSLASVPDGPECKHIRDAISQQIEQAKTKINSSKPLASRLEGCQAALDRSKKRLAAAESLAQSALAAREIATAEVTKFQAELNEVQSLIAQQATNSQDGSCLDKLHTQMQSIVAEMSSSVHVEVSESQQAMQQMTTLFRQLTGIAAKAQMAALAAAQNTGQEKERLRKLLIDNAVASPVEPLTPPVPPVTSVGEPSTQVVTGGG